MINVKYNPSRHPIFVSFLVLLGVIAILLFVSEWFDKRLEDSTPDFPPLQFDAEKVERQRQRHLAQVTIEPNAESIQELTTAVRAANLAQFSKIKDPNASAQRLRYLATDVVVDFGYRGFMKVGAAIKQRCRKGIGELTEAIENGVVTMETAATNPPSEFETYRQYCGNVLPHLKTFGLVNSEGQWAIPRRESGLIFDIWQRYRWANLIGSMRNPYRLLTSEERRIFSRWRIERAEGFSFSERLELIRNVESYLPYPTEFARGVVALREEETKRAISAFQKLLERSTEPYPKARKWLSRQSGAEQKYRSP